MTSNRDSGGTSDGKGTNGRPVLSRRNALFSIGGIGLLPGRVRAGDSEAPDRKVRVATYNVHHGSGTDGRLDLERVARTIRDSGAEVVGLQEVDVHWSGRSGFRDQARSLAAELEMEYFFAPIYDLDPPEPGRPRRRYGLAVLSEYPVLDSTNHEITRLSTQSDSGPEPAPGFPEVVVNVRGVKLRFYATHLDYRADPTVRRMQVADMLEITTAVPGPKVLVGDLNASPDAPELTPLWDEFRDAWTTRHEAPGFTYPAGDPTARIDYVLASPDVEPTGATVPDSLASDHRPVVADLSLPGSAVGAGWKR